MRILYFQKLAPIPAERDPQNYYFIGALIALSCAAFGGAMIVITAKVRSQLQSNKYLIRD